jgi:hypothetical protein
MPSEEHPAPPRNHKGVIGDRQKTRTVASGRKREPRYDADDGAELNVSSLNIWEAGFLSPTLAHVAHLFFLHISISQVVSKREEKKGQKGEQGKNEYRNL